MDQVTDVAALAARVQGVLVPGSRLLVGVVGEPGAGKSTVAAELASDLTVGGASAVVVPMDGFHLANVELARLGLAARKGTLETFDGWGFAALLGRLCRRDEDVVYAPTYDRSIEESVAGAVAVGRDVDVVVTEGNYVLVEAQPWGRVRPLLDLVAYVDVDASVRRERLVARHVAFGKAPAAAQAWVDFVDEPNAAVIRATRRHADVVLLLS